MSDASQKVVARPAAQTVLRLLKRHSASKLIHALKSPMATLHLLVSEIEHELQDRSVETTLGWFRQELARHDRLVGRLSTLLRPRASRPQDLSLASLAQKALAEASQRSPKAVLHLESAAPTSRWTKSRWSSSWPSFWTTLFTQGRAAPCF
jgi:hypothetical protein